MRYGERKQQILKHVREHPGCTSAEAGRAVGIDEARASTYMLNYVNGGLLTRARKEGESFKYYIRGTVVTAPLVRVEPPAPPPAEAPAPEAPVQAASSHKIGDVLAGVVDSIATALAEMIVERIEPVLAAKLAALADEAVNTAAATTRQSAASLPGASAPIIAKPTQVHAQRKRICIVGLLPGQANMIENEFGAKFKFNFFESDNAIAHLRSAAETADEVLVFANKISHKHTEAINAVRDSTIVVHGGMTSLRAKLTDIAKAV